MRKLFLAALLLNFTLFVHAQQNNANDTTDYSKEIKSVQIPPMFPGGINTWKLYLERNGLKAGVDSIDNQTAIVSFLVDKEGNVSEITVKNEDKIDPKLAAKAKRIIIKGPSWVPAVQNGRNAITRKIVLVTW